MNRRQAKKREKKQEMKQFIRFGNIPFDGVSKCHKGDAILRVEKGISVWECAFVNDVPFPLLPSEPSEVKQNDTDYM